MVRIWIYKLNIFDGKEGGIIMYSESITGMI